MSARTVWRQGTNLTPVTGEAVEETIPTIPAATIVLMHDGKHGLEVLLLRRNQNARFAPGAYVFPGGRVDPVDGEVAILDRVGGLTTKTAALRLKLTGSQPPAIAYYVAALREAFEESGILVALRADGSIPPTAAENKSVRTLREDLMAGRIHFKDVLVEMDCRLSGNALQYVAHWITPVSWPVRFDTHFFAAQLPNKREYLVDRREMTEGLWITPDNAIRRHEAGSLPMILPTITTLERLTTYERTEEALAALAKEQVRPVLPVTDTTPADLQRQHAMPS